MSKGVMYRKSTLKKSYDRNSIHVDRISDDELNRRRLCYQLIDKEKQRNFAMNDCEKSRSQLEMLRDILLKNQNINDLIQKSNGSDRIISKNHLKNDGKISSAQKIRPASAKNYTFINYDQTEENLSTNSTEEEPVGHQSFRHARSHERNDQKHSIIRSHSHYSDTNDVRAMSKVSFNAHTEKSNDHESNMNTSSIQLRKLLDRLTTELSDLESMTGYKPTRNDLSSNTCSLALATALLTLTGHVKQCTPTSKGKQELNTLKDQLSLVIKTQLDFQQKIENQMTTLQTMMQTICQLVNHEIISNRKPCGFHHDRNQFDGQSCQNWTNNVQKSYIAPKEPNNGIEDLLALAQQMTNDTNLHSVHNEMNAPKQRSTAITPVEPPTSYNVFASGLLSQDSSINALRNEPDSSNTVPPHSKNEALLAKILHERLRLAQQMTELNKQHNTTQEELAELEAKTRQPCTNETNA
ncbi:unnamed protein product [Adineta ricciae]|uniref:Coiled-coil domain-containing protein 52 n=1 Tax=Adineta ricciae TaxID=249248 RepID=A0A813X8Q9_ADIRI|nr:unnamed protein product [Adineta ricciae]CAF1008224.1 unnamed protein product [Adineta ricciae]